MGAVGASSGCSSSLWFRRPVRQPRAPPRLQSRPLTLSVIQAHYAHERTRAFRPKTGGDHEGGGEAHWYQWDGLYVVLYRGYDATDLSPLCPGNSIETSTGFANISNAPYPADQAAACTGAPNITDNAASCGSLLYYVTEIPTTNIGNLWGTLELSTSEGFVGQTTMGDDHADYRRARLRTRSFGLRPAGSHGRPRRRGDLHALKHDHRLAVDPIVFDELALNRDVVVRGRFLRIAPGARGVIVETNPELVASSPNFAPHGSDIAVGIDRDVVGRCEAGTSFRKDVERRGPGVARIEVSVKS